MKLIIDIQDEIYNHLLYCKVQYISGMRNGKTFVDKMLYAIANGKPQPTGHWIEKDGYDGDTYYDCSECGESFCLIDGTPTDNLYNFCPNCGADMRGKR